ncbi:MAG: bifunctional diguanylate cyclase/phosphodiesterase [Pseudomonadota bacterium]
MICLLGAPEGAPSPISGLTSHAPSGERIGWLVCIPQEGEPQPCCPIRMTHQRLGDDSILLELHDESECARLRQQLEQDRFRDDLTGLSNRQALATMLHAIHQGEQDYAALLIDIDRFKVINDFHGHSRGDETLIYLGRYLQESMGAGDHLGRWSGHEFLCLLPGRDIDQAHNLADSMRQHVRTSFQDASADGPHIVTVSIGVAVREVGDPSHEAVIARADAALYEAKRRGRNRVVNQREIGKSIFIASAEIEAALREDRLIPAYQPIVELCTRRIVADEALARIRGRDGELLPAGLFIEAASALQIAHRIDQSIVSQAIERCAQSVIDAPGRPPISHFVNISTDLLRHPRRIEAILEVARTAAARCNMACEPNKPLVVEITERELLNDPREALDILRPFLDFGLQIAVDDFGSGYSSFLYLLDLPVTYLKIEGALVQRLRHDRKARAIIQGIQSIASQLDLTTIAEFIEDEETARILTDLGVDWGQGYLFGRPRIEGEPAACEPRVPLIYSGLHQRDTCTQP